MDLDRAFVIELNIRQWIRSILCDLIRSVTRVDSLVSFDEFLFSISKFVVDLCCVYVYGC